MLSSCPGIFFKTFVRAILVTVAFHCVYMYARWVYICANDVGADDHKQTKSIHELQAFSVCLDAR